MVRTFVIDPNRLSREGLAHILSQTPFEVVGYASDVTSAVSAKPGASDTELILVGTTGASSDLRDEIQELRTTSPDAKVVVLSSALHPKIVATCFAADIDGFLHQDISSRALIASLDLILAGERVFPSQVFSLAFRRQSMSSTELLSETSSVHNLSKRELEILHLLVAGLSNKGIANRLDVAEATIKVHLKSILRKIGVQNRTQAAIWALSNGMGQDTEVRNAS